MRLFFSDAVSSGFNKRKSLIKRHGASQPGDCGQEPPVSYSSLEYPVCHIVSQPFAAVSQLLSAREAVVSFGMAITLSEALGLVQHGQSKLRKRTLFLDCGFEPLHLGTFLQAHFSRRFPDEAADIRTGLYGDLEG